MQTYHFIVYFLTGLIVAAGSAPIWIPFFVKLKFGQFIREEGPQSHHKKAGTPTFGGVIFIFSALVSALIFGLLTQNVLALALGLLGYGLIGFLDDYIKVVKKNNLGLSAWQKIVGLLVVTFALFFIFFQSHISIFYFNLFTIQFWPLWLVVFVFIAIATTNSVNLTDGIDGLCSSVTLIVSLFFSLYAYNLGLIDLVLINLIMAGALVGYLLFNWHPAKVFMGDTGSLALGGYVFVNAVILNLEWFIPIFGIVYLIESISVIIQVAYFKRTGGKRFFKMTPIHHHFEMLGWSEVKIVSVASTITLIGCLLSYWVAVS